MREENSTPVRWLVMLDTYDRDGESPLQYLIDGEGTRRIEFLEEPDQRDGTWIPSDLAFRVTRALNSAPAVEKLIRAASALARDAAPSAVLHAKDGGGDVGISVNAHAIHRLQRALALLEAE